MKSTIVFLCVTLIAAALASGQGQGACRNAGARYPDGDLESCAGIQLQHSGGFAPFEFIENSEMRGLSPDFARMLDEKGYLRQAKCPYGHFDFIDNPFFGSAVNSAIVGGVSRQYLGSNLQTGSSNVDVAGDWGNTTVRRRFLCPSAGYTTSPTHAFICNNAQGDCNTDSSSWTAASATLVEAAGFENSAECAAEFISGTFDADPVTVASNVELGSVIESRPGDYALLPVGTAQDLAASNGDIVVLDDRIKCAAAYGFITRKDDEDLCNCLTRAINLVDPYDYAEVCCNGDKARFNLCIQNSDDVDDQGTIQLPQGFDYAWCSMHF